MYCVGLTGPIASGKSTVAAFFAKLGIEIISADQIAQDLTAKSQPAFHAIIKHFGKQLLTSEGKLNRRELRQIIVKDNHERQWLESLLHPLIRSEIERRISKASSPYCLIEIPLLTDKTNYAYLNRVLLIQAQPEQQIARLMARDNSSKKEALAMLTIQPNEQKRQALADDIVKNTGSLAELEKQILELHDSYLAYEQARRT